MWSISGTHHWIGVLLSTDVSFLRLVNKVQSRVHARVIPQLHLTLNGGVPVVLHSIISPDRRQTKTVVFSILIGQL